MGRIYMVSFEKVAVSAAQDLFEIVAAAETVVFVNELTLAQDSEEGDAQDELLSILLHRATTSGSGGSTPTARPLDPGDAAFGGTVEANNTTQGTEGNILLADAFNVRQGYARVWPPERRIVIPGQGRLVVELQDAPADEITMSGSLEIEEAG